MSYHNDDQLVNSNSHGEYQYGSYHTPNQVFYPPQGAPPLPGLAQLPPFVYHHGFVTHPQALASPEAIPAAAQLQMMHQHGFSHQSNSSPAETTDKDTTKATLTDNCEDDDESPDKDVAALYATPKAPTTNHHYYATDPPAQVLPSLRKSPYFGGHLPPLPPTQALTVSPADHQEQSTKIYQYSPYFSEAPSLDNGSGSSESTASTSSGKNSRPVPAKSSFMCFSEARKNEITARMGSTSRVSSYTCYLRPFSQLPFYIVSLTVLLCVQ